MYIKDIARFFVDPDPTQEVIPWVNIEGTHPGLNERYTRKTLTLEPRW